MGLMFRRRRPVARLAVGAAAAGVAYHAGSRRAEQDLYNQEADAAYNTNETEPRRRSMSHPRPRRRAARSTSSAGSPRCTSPAR